MKKLPFLFAVLPVACACPSFAEGDAAPEVYKVEGDAIRVPPGTPVRAEALGDARTPRSLVVAGRTALDPERTAHLKGQFTGRTKSVAVVAGAKVKAGDELCVIESFDLAGAKGNYLSAKRQAAADQAQIAADKVQEDQDGDTLRRTERLAAKGVLPEKTLLDARSQVAKDKAASAKDEAALAKDEAAAAAARQQLLVFGLAEADLDAVEKESGDDRRTYRLRSPRDGVVLERNVTPGELADPGTVLFTVSDTASLWVWADVPEDAAASVAVGQAMRVTTAADAKRKLECKVEWISPTLDADKHTLKVRGKLDNAGGKLLSDMSCRIEIEAAAGEPTLPAAAVVRGKDGAVALVEDRAEKDGTWYRKVAVEAEPAGPGRVRVVSGVKPGDKVVVAETLGLVTEMAQQSK